MTANNSPRGRASSSRTILNVGQNYHIRGGSDQYLLALEKLLRQRGHEIIPFAAAHPQNQPSDWSIFFPDAIDFKRPGLGDALRFVYSPGAARAMSKLLERRTPDIAHLHIYYGQLTASILKPLREAGVPIVQTLHEYKVVCPTYSLFAHGKVCEACDGRHFWRAAARRCNRGSFARSALSAAEAYVSKWLGAVDKIDHFVAVSDFLRDKVISLGLSPDKITTVHNFMDCTDVVPADAPGGYLLYFGRLERIKGIYTLLEAVAPLRNTPVLIVGDGNEKLSLLHEIARRGLDHVKLLGFKHGQELHDLIRGSVCTIAPSECYETFGLTLLESFAHGRPVVASRIGGMTEVVADGDDGFLVQPGEATELRERLLWLMEHPVDALEMGRRGRVKVEEQFSPERHYEQIMAIYKSVGPA